MTYRIRTDLPPGSDLAYWAAGLEGEVYPVKPGFEQYDHEFVPTDIGYPDIHVFDHEVEPINKEA